MLGGQRKRYLNELQALLAEIDYNRMHISQARGLMRSEMRRPALWMDLGQRGLRAYSHTRTALVLSSRLLGILRIGRVFRLVRLLPLAVAGWGAYRLMQR